MAEHAKHETERMVGHPLAGQRPSKIIAVHLSYRSRALERGRLPAWPSYFLKPPSTLAADGEPVLRPPSCELLAFEGEVALVIGPRAARVSPAEAWSHVRWVTAANDFGVYDLRYADSGSNVRSKGIDGFTPLGPGLLDARVVDPERVRLRTWVNGELAQDAVSGDDLLFSFADIVADASRLTTLEPGDVILTGTPTGSTVVRPGDLVEVEVSAAEAGGVAWLSTGRLRSPIAEAGYALSPPGAMPNADDAQREAAYGAGGAPGPADSPADLLRAVGKVSTATLSSQLRKRGFNSLTLDGLHATKPGAKMVGFARTLRYVPFREDLFAARGGTLPGGGLNAQKRAVEQVRPGEVLVIEARGDPTAGTVGDILALRAQVRGRDRHRRRDQGQPAAARHGPAGLLRRDAPGRARAASRPVGGQRHDRVRRRHRGARRHYRGRRRRGHRDSRAPGDGGGQGRRRAGTAGGVRRRDGGQGRVRRRALPAGQALAGRLRGLACQPRGAGRARGAG
jgi:2-keto-4-pentenoate hydratase/2-oxohepta-3-ene-1,7-dioic acid hydratase in catechol pathway